MLILPLFLLYTSFERFNCDDININTSLNHPILLNASQEAIQTRGAAQVIDTLV
jgi:hypothetical protein